MSAKAQVPERIPPELVYEYDHYLDPGLSSTPQSYLAKKLHSEAPPIFYTPKNGGHWVVTRAEYAKSMLRDYEKFSSRMDFLPHRAATNSISLLPINLDPPEQLDVRRVINPSLSPMAVDALQAKIREAAAMFIDKVVDKGGCDFMADIARQFPIYIFMLITKGPLEDRGILTEMAETYMHSPEPAKRARGFQDLCNYLSKFVSERRKNPGDDVISHVLAGTIQGRPMTDEEILGTIFLFFLAGLDTTAAMLTFIMQYLARNPDHYAKLVQEPARISAVLEELIRNNGVAVIERGVREDVVYEGIPFNKNDRIVFITALPGMDDRENSQPFKVDFERAECRHTAFGWGPHHCAGSFLARAEIRIFLEEWVKRVPDFGLKPGATVHVAGGSSWVADSMPLVWPAQSRGI